MIEKESKPAMKRKKIQFAFHDEDADSVCIPGDFNGWNEKKHVMKRDSRNIWRKTVMLPPGTYEYRFKVDDRWENDPQNENVRINCFGTINNVLEIS
ncbi:MAG: isoamylase early set domain-containing protein [Desulfobacteraceae bacterium]|nr:isoamylase early set domain-containing protein [Desulfobacteraceae bacterium]